MDSLGDANWGLLMIEQLSKRHICRALFEGLQSNLHFSVVPASHMHGKTL